jgi:hypothetical protein
MNNTVAESLVEHMRQHFEEYVDLAEKVDSPNPEDTAEIKCGIVAFSIVSEPGKWTQDEYEFIKSRLDDTPQQLSDDIRKLKAMCLGAMCAMRLEGQMDNGQFALADAQLPGQLLALEA